MDRFFSSLKIHHIVLLFLLFGVVLYGQTMNFPAVNDSLSSNPYYQQVQDTDFAVEVKSSSVFLSARNNSPAHIDFVTSLIRRLSQDDDGVHHAYQFVFHILNSLGVFFILVVLGLRRLFSIGVSLLFLVHPATSEVAVNVNASAYAFSVLCVLSSVFLYLLLMKSDGDFWIVKFVSACVLLTLGILVNSVSWIGVLSVCFLEWYYHKGKREHCKLRYGCLIVMVVGLMVSAIACNNFEILKVIQTAAIKDWLRVGIAIPSMIAVYLKTLILPLDIHVFRMHHFKSFDYFSVLILGAAVVLIRWMHQLFTVEQIFIFRLGCVWFLITIAPGINLWPHIVEFSFVDLSDKNIYLPVVGVSLMVLSCFCCLFDRIRIPFVHVMQRVAFGLAIVILAMGAFYQSRVWASSVKLYSRSVRFEPDVAGIRLLLARELVAGGYYEQAAVHLNQARLLYSETLNHIDDHDVKNTYRGIIKNIWYDMGRSLRSAGQVDQAVQCVKEALQSYPEDIVLTEELGLAYALAGEWDSSIEEYYKVLQSEPERISTLTHLADAYVAIHQFDQAEYWLRRVIDSNPAYSPAVKLLNRLTQNN